ncbi:MAG: serine--tRNA ligase, partial [Clostridia bacterium]|nr:serine--tRNA ligase [Clostridia bacterium]
MLDIKLFRTNPDIIRENIKKKFQDDKLPLVDEIIKMDEDFRRAKQRADELRAMKNKISKEIGALMGQGKKDEAEEAKKKVGEAAAELAECEKQSEELTEEIRRRIMIIPNIIDPSVPIGKDDSENVEKERFGDPFVPDFEIPY